jgi:transcriptional regulator with XRE-family HTH domain
MCYKNFFAQRLATLRRDKKLSLQQVGDAIGKSNQAISLFEKGGNLPSFEVLCQLADYFGVSLDYLVGRSDNPEVNLENLMRDDIMT